ncbi:hypothetical protein EMPG_16562 [Blastomyces silverae]|uniref:Uncharacterized protein n=1 Tax=Blastomyces silverae TaxID=2060906 RepID=A0A0H1B945_9EURO|nr:hypothetical protein EMPG_16562 [Blastomyces silverae]
MSSLFSSKLKTQRSSLTSKENDPSDLPTHGYRGSGSKSTFSKMRKRRPPPINISLGDANVFISGMNPSSQTTGSEMPWSPASPPIHPPPGCVNQIHREWESAMAMSPPLSPCYCCQRFWPTPVGPSQLPQTPTTQCFSIAAELPGSVVGPPESVELDVASTPIRNLKPLEHGETQTMGGSPPDLLNSPDWGDYSRVFDSDRSEPQNRRRNDKLCADMDFWELLEVLPTLSAGDIKKFWHPAMVQQTKSIDRRNLKPRYEARVDSANMQEELYTLADLETVKQHCEEQLNAKEAEITELRQLHERRLNMLCDFISTHSGPEPIQSTDPAAPSNARTDILINPNQQRPDRPLSPNTEHSKRTQAQSRFRSGSYPPEGPTNLPHTSQTEHNHRTTTTTTFPNDPNTNPNASIQESNLALTMKLKHYEATTRNLKQDLQEKDAQIAILDRKVAQLLNMAPVPAATSFSSSSSYSSFSASSSSSSTSASSSSKVAAVAREVATLPPLPKIEKDLPLPPSPPRRRPRHSDSKLYLKRGTRHKAGDTIVTITGVTGDSRI